MEALGNQGFVLILCTNRYQRFKVTTLYNYRKEIVVFF
jgi:hypothetical protein